MMRPCLKSEEAFTPPLPFAEAERKAGPDGAKHNTVPGRLHTTEITLLRGRCVRCQNEAAWLKVSASPA